MKSDELASRELANGEMTSRAQARRRGAAALALLAVAAALAPPATARADTRRTVAVLEHRTGSSELPGLATRIATELGRLTDLGVASPDQARAMFGEQLDAEVVHCAGDGECLADLGYRLHVDEVVLVGVSEFGVPVVTLQRIDVATRKVDARVAESFQLGQSPSDAALEGYLTRLLPPAAFLRFGVIDVVANLPGATVRLGGHARGQTPLAPLRVRAPETYDLRVERAGYVPFSATVEVPPEGTLKVTARLVKARRAAWYQKRWVVGAAIASLAVAVGSVVYVATRGDDGLTLGGEIK
ncbi:MAG: PEGA domain-containing protein [Kofleriaceae bacterium]